MEPYVMHSSLDGRTHPSRWRPKGAPAIDGARGAPFVFDSTEADCDKRAPLTAMTLESTRQLSGGVLLLRYLIQNDAAGQ